MVKIAILDLTNLPAEIGGGDKVGALIKAWLQPAMPDDELTVLRIADGAPLPAVADFDGFVLSGSEMGVYDTPAWMAPLRALLLDIRAAGTPLFGICFGHQIMADTFGGKAELVDLGEVIGAQEYTVEGQQTDALVWHQDQVTEVPQNATVIASAPYCPVGALAYDFPAMSVQFHPEYTAPFLDMAITASIGSHLTLKAAESAIATLQSAKVPVNLMAIQVAKLLTGGR